MKCTSKQLSGIFRATHCIQAGLEPLPLAIAGAQTSNASGYGGGWRFCDCVGQSEPTRGPGCGMPCEVGAKGQQACCVLSIEDPAP